MSRVASFLSEADEKGRAGDKRAPRLPGQWLSTCRGAHPREVSVRCRKDRAEDFAPRETKLTERTQISLNPEVAGKSESRRITKTEPNTMYQGSVSFQGAFYKTSRLSGPGAPPPHADELYQVCTRGHQHRHQGTDKGGEGD